MLTATEINEARKSRDLLYHLADAEPNNRKGWMIETLLWALDTLTPILIKNGEFKKPGLFARFKLVAFSVELVKRIIAGIKSGQPKKAA